MQSPGFHPVFYPVFYHGEAQSTLPLFLPNLDGLYCAHVPYREEFDRVPDGSQVLLSGTLFWHGYRCGAFCTDPDTLARRDDKSRLG